MVSSGGTLGDFSDMMGYVYTVRVDGTDLTIIGATTTQPAWSRDSQEVVFAKHDGEIATIVAAKSDGTGAKTLWQSPARQEAATVRQVAWSPVKPDLLFVWDGVYVLDIEEEELRRIVKPEFGKISIAAWSPDGSLVAIHYHCHLDRKFLEIDVKHLIPFCDPNTKFTLTVSADGTDLRFLASSYGQEPFSAIGPARPNIGADPSICSAGVVVPDPLSNPGLVKDCEVLLVIRDTLAGDGSLLWNDKQVIDKWPGVSLARWGQEEPESGIEGSKGTLQVRQLAIHCHRAPVNGTLPPQLGELTVLEVLSIPGCLEPGTSQLTGTIPLELGKLSNLRRLALHGNSLMGPIPPELGNLGSLTHLYLNDNNLSGIVPLELAGDGKRERVLLVRLGGNLVMQEIPTELAEVHVKIEF